MALEFEVSLLGLLAVTITAALLCLRWSEFKPWQIELWNMKRGTSPWLSKLLSILFYVTLFSPEIVAFIFALYVLRDKIGILSSLCAFAVFTKIFLQILWELIFWRKKLSSDKIFVIGTWLSEGLLALCIVCQIIIMACPESVFAIIFFSFSFSIAVFELYKTQQGNCLEISHFFNVALEFFTNKIQNLQKENVIKVQPDTNTKIEPDSSPKAEEEKKDSARSRCSECPSVPDEHSEEAQDKKKSPLNSLDLPPIPLELLDLQVACETPKVKQEKIEVQIGAFSTLSASKSNEVEICCQKEMKEILDSALIRTRVIPKSFIAFLLAMYIVTMALYSVGFAFLAKDKYYYIGLGNFIYLFLYDSTAISWGKSKLHKTPVSKSFLALLLLFARIVIALDPYEFEILKEIPQGVLGILVVLSLRDYYFPIEAGSAPDPPIWLEHLFHRFEFQFFLVILGSLPFSLIPIFHYEYSSYNMHFCIIIFFIVTLFESLSYLIWDRLYTKYENTLTLNVILVGVGFWLFWVGLVLCSHLFIDCVNFYDSLCSVLILHPMIFVFIILYRHWVKNDYNFYETLPEDSPELNNSTSQEPLQSTKELQTPVQNTNISFCEKIKNTLKSYIPNTKNNVKVCICMILFIILGGAPFMLFSNSYITMVIFSFVSWIHSLILICFAAFGYFKKLYQVTLTNAVLLLLGMHALFSWSSNLLVHKQDELEKNLIVLVVVRWLWSLCISLLCIIVGIFNLIDNEFEISKTTISSFGAAFVLLELWGIFEYFSTDLLIFLIIVNVILPMFIVLLLFQYFWKRNNYRFPKFIVIIFIFLIAAAAIFASFFTLFTGRKIALQHFLLLSLPSILIIQIFRYIHFYQNYHKFNLQYEIASEHFFPIFAYNPENMRMTSGNRLSHTVIFGSSLIQCYSLSLFFVLPENQKNLTFFSVCIAHALYWLYIYNKVKLTRQISTKKLEVINSKDLALCMRQALAFIEGKVGNGAEHLGLNEIVSSVKIYKKVNILQARKDIIKDRIRGSCLSQSSLSIENASDPDISNFESQLPGINLTESSLLEKFEAYEKTVVLLKKYKEMQKAFLPAFLTNIELQSEMKIGQQAKALVKRIRKTTKLEEIRDEQNRIDSILRICYSGDQERQFLDYDGYRDPDFDYNSFPKPCAWTRAKNLFRSDFTHVLFSENTSYHIQQGELNDCWVIAAISLLTPPYLEKIFKDVSEQSLEEGRYILNLYSNGNPKQIEIDDYFPCTRESLQALCCQPILNFAQKKKIIWPLLVEKAIAKEYNGYNYLEGGAIDYALMLMTGNPAFRYNLGNESTQLLIVDGSLWKKVLKYNENSFSLGAGTLREGEMPLVGEGLKEAHAYAILDVFEFDGNKLLLLKDPWGYSSWRGDWSASSTKWTIRMKKYISNRKKELKKKHSDNDFLRTESHLGYGQISFYISWSDFIKAFEVIFVSISFDENWDLIKFEDRWELGRAGGSSENTKTVKENPQYLLKITQKIQIFCLLTQHISPSSPQIPKIGFCIFRYNNNVIGENDSIPEMIAIGRYSRERAISLNTEIEIGQYVLLISTHQPGEYGSFTFQIWFPRNRIDSTRKAITWEK